MDNLLKTKTIGHPIVMFGENSLNITERIFCLSFFFLGILRKKYFSKIQPQKFSLNYWLRKSLNLIYFSKTESRKKRYEINRKIKELFLSTIGIKSCLTYGNFRTVKKYHIKKTSEIYKLYPIPIYQLILRFKANKNLFCFQAGETGIFLLNSIDKIVLNDLQNNKITHMVNSNLTSVNHLSTHPTFPPCLLASSMKCSEFWKISSDNQKTSLYNIYHKDPVIFQKYRNKEDFVDFGTSNMKWKCLDEVTQKFIFSHQFNENIVDISVNKDNHVSVIRTVENIYIFDNRNNKPISKFKINDKKSSWVNWLDSKCPFDFIYNGFILYDGKYQNNNDSKLYTKNKLKLNGHSKLFILKKRKTLNIISKSYTHIINSQNKITGLMQNNSGSLIGLLNNNQINIIRVR